MFSEFSFFLIRSLSLSRSFSFSLSFSISLFRFLDLSLSLSLPFSLSLFLAPSRDLSLSLFLSRFLSLSLSLCRTDELFSCVYRMEEGGLVLEDLLGSVLYPDTTLIPSFLNRNTSRWSTLTSKHLLYVKLRLIEIWYVLNHNLSS